MMRRREGRPPSLPPRRARAERGSVRGLAHVGVVKALTEAGVRPAVVTGTSAGSLIGAAVAAGMGWEELAEMARTGGDFPHPGGLRPGPAFALVTWNAGSPAQRGAHRPATAAPGRGGDRARVRALPAAPPGAHRRRPPAARPPRHLRHPRRRSEERRVGKECRPRWSPEQYTKQR